MDRCGLGIQRCECGQGTIRRITMERADNSDRTKGTHIWNTLKLLRILVEITEEVQLLGAKQARYNNDDPDCEYKYRVWINRLELKI